jgi:hypothetical protein
MCSRSLRHYATLTGLQASVVFAYFQHNPSHIMKAISIHFSLKYLILLLPCGLQAAVVSLTGGALSITYDGAAFADTANSNYGLSPSKGDFMRYGRYWQATDTVGVAPNYIAKQPQAFRPLPFTTLTGNPRQPNFRDNRATLDPLYPEQSPAENLTVNGSDPIPNSAGRNRLSTNLSYDPNDLAGTVSGLIQTNGVSAWWFANDDLMDAGIAWISWGDLSLRYDPSRISQGYSGWVFANQLGGIGDIFDTKITSMSVSSSGLSLQGELWGSDGTSSDPYNENYATWESYTLMNPNVKIGTFNFSGVTAVPEPSAALLCGAAGIGLLIIRRRRQV